MSLRTFARLGSSLALLAGAQLGASFALRRFARLGSSMAVVDFFHVGAALSLRGVGRVGSSLSLFGLSRFGSLFSLSVLDLICMGASLSIRSVARVGSSIAVLDFFHLGSSLAMRSFSRVGRKLSVFGELKASSVETDSGMTVPTNTPLYFGSTNTYIKEESGDLKFYVGGSRSVTMESDGGVLHGSWSFESMVVTSDKRLKQEIRPLHRTLLEALPMRVQDTEATREVASPTSRPDRYHDDGALWLLRQLRPVSYKFRAGPDAKFTRFGFIADELEQLADGNLVRITKNQAYKDQKAVVYQDLIALLTAGMQSQMKMVEELLIEMTSVKAEIEELRQFIKRHLTGV